MSIKPNAKTLTALSAAMIATAALFAAPVQAETPTYTYNSPAAKKYGGSDKSVVSRSKVRKSFDRSLNRSVVPLRAGNNGRSFNFGTNPRNRTRIKISR